MTPIPDDCIAHDSPAGRLAASKPRAARKYRHGVPRFNVVYQTTILEHRNALGLTMRDVAAAVGLSLTGMFAVEHGGNVELRHAMDIAEFFGVTIETLWRKLP